MSSNFHKDPSPVEAWITIAVVVLLLPVLLPIAHAALWYRRRFGSR